MSAVLEILPHGHDPTQFGHTLSRLKAATKSILDGVGLFINLFQHKMGEPVQFSIFGPPFNRFRTPLNQLCRSG